MSAEANDPLTETVADLIIRGGDTVHPRQVEEALYEHPAVAEIWLVDGHPKGPTGQILRRDVTAPTA